MFVPNIGSFKAKPRSPVSQGIYGAVVTKVEPHWSSKHASNPETDPPDGFKLEVNLLDGPAQSPDKYGNTPQVENRKVYGYLSVPNETMTEGRLEMLGLQWQNFCDSAGVPYDDDGQFNEAELVGKPVKVKIGFEQEKDEATGKYIDKINDDGLKSNTIKDFVAPVKKDQKPQGAKTSAKSTEDDGPGMGGMGEES